MIVLVGNTFLAVVVSVAFIGVGQLIRYVERQNRTP